MDILSADIQHSMKHDSTQKPHATHAENGTPASSESGSPDEKNIAITPSRGAGYDLGPNEVENGEYVVTMKTWAVVFVSIHNFLTLHANAHGSRFLLFPMLSLSGQFLS